ncbi:MAG: D-sedoheptulose 7-phosphate isomerase [Desulfuromonadales bacterium]
MEKMVQQMVPDIRRCALTLIDAMARGNKLLVMGNGGSAADAQHMAAEFIGRFLRNRKALPAVALTTDTSILTAVGNDFGFDEVFSRQVEGLAAPGDIVLGISTSGQSPNVLKALSLARERGCTTMALAGKDGGPIAQAVDLALVVPAAHTPFIQEAHLTIIHILCDLVEEALCTPTESA